MWLRIVYLATSFLYLSGSASACTTTNEGLGNIKQDAISKILCAVNYEKCNGQNLSSGVYVSNEKIYKLEVYELKPPANLSEPVNEQINLLMSMQRLENNLQEQVDGVRSKLEAIEDNLREEVRNISERIKNDTETLKLELAQKGIVCSNTYPYHTSLGSINKHRFAQLSWSGYKASVLKLFNASIARKVDEPPTVESNVNLPASCAEAFEKDVKAGNGIYKLQLPNFDLPPFEVYCLADPDGGPAWTIVQRITEGSVNFHRGWDDYVSGFGNLGNDFFIGLKKLYALTNDQLNELWIHTKDDFREEHNLMYADFAIGNESDNYALNELDGFTGDVADFMSSLKGQQFTTKDCDNDKEPIYNCAITFESAGWYNRCGNSHINEQYLAYGGFSKYTGYGSVERFEYVHIAIRPRLGIS